MKGMSLPINVVIILIVALLVLVGAAALFSNGIGWGDDEMKNQEYFQKACGALKMMGCDTADVSTISLTIDDTPTSLSTMCSSFYGIVGDDKCCQACCGQGKCSSSTTS